MGKDGYGAPFLSADDRKLIGISGHQNSQKTGEHLEVQRKDKEDGTEWEHKGKAVYPA